MKDFKQECVETGLKVILATGRLVRSFLFIRG